MHRTENKTPDASIPWATYPGKSIFVHGSTVTRDWRTRLFSFLDPYSVLVLDAWRTDWSDYADALSSEIEAFEDFGSSVIASGVGGVGTGIVGGYTPITPPDINNSPFFWENRNVAECDFHFFEFDSNEQIASHVVMLMSAAIKKDPEKVVVRIPKADWRVNISTFLKYLPRENYFGEELPAFERLKKIMEL